MFKAQFWTTCSFCHKTVSLQRTCSNLFWDRSNTSQDVSKLKMYNKKKVLKHGSIMLPEMQNRRSAQELCFPLTKVCCMNMKVEPINNSPSSEVPRDLFCSNYSLCSLILCNASTTLYACSEKFGDLHTKQLWRICFYPF